MTPADHANTVFGTAFAQVRDALKNPALWEGSEMQFAALDLIERRATELEASEAEWQRRGDRAIAAEQRAEALEKALRRISMLAHDDAELAMDIASAALSAREEAQ